MKKVCVLLAGALLVLGCHKPACRGKVSDKDLATWQQKAQKGQPACEELAQASVKLVNGGVDLNGEQVNVDIHTDRREPIAVLEKPLGADRETWTRIHTGQLFKANVDLTIPADRPAAQGVSVTYILANEGFTHATMHSGDVTLTADLWPGPGKIPASVAHVERTNGSELRLRFSGPGAPASSQRILSPNLDDLSAQITKQWTGADTTPRALVVRTETGTFYDELKLARDLLALPALAHAAVLFEVGRPVN